MQGNEILTPVQSYQSQFFVIDEKPDTAVCTVLPGLHIGSQDAATNVEGMKEKGVTHILNVAFYISNPFASEFTLETVEMADEPGVRISQFFSRCFEFINSARRNGGGVLVHWYVFRKGVKAPSLTQTASFRPQVRSLKLLALVLSQSLRDFRLMGATFHARKKDADSRKKKGLWLAIAPWHSEGVNPPLCA